MATAPAIFLSGEKSVILEQKKTLGKTSLSRKWHSDSLSLLRILKGFVALFLAEQFSRLPGDAFSKDSCSFPLGFIAVFDRDSPEMDKGLTPGCPPRVDQQSQDEEMCDQSHFSKITPSSNIPCRDKHASNFAAKLQPCRANPLLHLP